MKCPLCEGARVEEFHRGEDPHLGELLYYECGNCRLVFLPPRMHPSESEARAHYEQHENRPSDERYIDYLRTLALPVRAMTGFGAMGLDYGCGPAPAMDRAFGEGTFVTSYDPLYRDRPAALVRTYDFITCCEVAEHFADPRGEFVRLDSLLRSGGVLGVRTEPRDPSGDFAQWWYHRDPTHITLYCAQTMEWIAGWRHWRLKRESGNVFLFVK